MSDHPMMACAVCARVLDYKTRVGYLHTMKDRFPEDHLAVPVTLDQVEVRGRCDFCSEDFPSMQLPCNDFAVPGLPGHMSNGAFAACVTCGEMISKGFWDSLSRRAARNSPLPFHLARELTEKLYKTMRRNITGPLEAIPTGRPE